MPSKPLRQIHLSDCTVWNVWLYRTTKFRIMEHKTIVGNRISHLRNVNQLGLEQNSINVLDEDMFSGMIALERLYLTGNGITVILANTFADHRPLDLLELFVDHFSYTEFILPKGSPEIRDDKFLFSEIIHYSGTFRFERRPHTDKMHDKHRMQMFQNYLFIYYLHVEENTY